MTITALRESSTFLDLVVIFSVSRRISDSKYLARERERIEVSRKTTKEMCCSEWKYRHQTAGIRCTKVIAKVQTLFSENMTEKYHFGLISFYFSKKKFQREKVRRSMVEKQTWFSRFMLSILCVHSICSTNRLFLPMSLFFRVPLWYVSTWKILSKAHESLKCM